MCSHCVHPLKPCGPEWTSHVPLIKSPRPPLAYIFIFLVKTSVKYSPWYSHQISFIMVITYQDLSSASLVDEEIASKPSEISVFPIKISYNSFIPRWVLRVSPLSIFLPLSALQRLYWLTICVLTNSVKRLVTCGTYRGQDTLLVCPSQVRLLVSSFVTTLKAKRPRKFGVLENIGQVTNLDVFHTLNALYPTKKKVRK